MWLPSELVRDLKFLEKAEHADRSTTVLCADCWQGRFAIGSSSPTRGYRVAIGGRQTHVGADRPRCQRVSMGDGGVCPRQKGGGAIRSRGSPTRSGNTVFGLPALGVPELQGLQSLCQALTTDKTRDHPDETIGRPGTREPQTVECLAACWRTSVQRGKYADHSESVQLRADCKGFR